MNISDVSKCWLYPGGEVGVRTHRENYWRGSSHRRGNPSRDSGETK